MKKLLWVALLGVLTMTACSKGGDDEKPVEKPGIAITEGQKNQTVYADENEGAGEVRFETTGAWTSSIAEGSATKGDTRAAATWIRINPASGSAAGSYEIEIILDENYTGADRTATITIVSGDDKIEITVTQKATTEEGQTPEIPVTGVSLNKTTAVLTVGDTETLTATVVPENAANKNVTWSSSDEAVATVDENGEVTAIAPGTAMITATTVNGAKTAECVVTVEPEPVPVTDVSLNKTTAVLTVGNTETLTASVFPQDADNKNVTWSSSDEAVATVDENGEVTAVSLGTATITVTTVEGKLTASCSVNVVQPDTSPESVVINGIEWGTRNVGAANSWDFGNYYTFAEAQTACPDGWRIPTVAELESLIASGYEWTSVNGINGGRYGSGGNTIFLPAAGRTMFDYGNTRGLYWSNNQREGGAVDYLSIQDQPSGSNIQTVAPGVGLSLRCARE